MTPHDKEKEALKSIIRTVFIDNDELRAQFEKANKRRAVTPNDQEAFQLGKFASVAKEILDERAAGPKPVPAGVVQGPSLEAMRKKSLGK